MWKWEIYGITLFPLHHSSLFFFFKTTLSRSAILYSLNIKQDTRLIAYFTGFFGPCTLDVVTLDLHLNQIYQIYYRQL